MQLSMACGERCAGLGMETAVNEKFLKTSSLLTSDFTAPLDPTGLTSSTHSYDERTTFWALIEDQRQHAHTIIALISAGMLQAKLTGRVRLYFELRRGAHDVCEWRCAGGGSNYRGRLN